MSKLEMRKCFSNGPFPFLKSILCVATVIVLSACNGPRVSTEAPVLNFKESGVYLVGISDRLNIDVWKTPELTSAVVVRPDGMITLPLIGDVLASGKSTGELGNSITEALKDYVRSPRVTVIVLDPASAAFRNRVRITGAVNNPSTIPYRDGMMVIDIVLEAGNLTEFAAPNRALLYRKNSDGVEAAYGIRLKDILNKGKMKTNYPLQPADVITVPERNF